MSSRPSHLGMPIGSQHCVVVGTCSQVHSGFSAAAHFSDLSQKDPHPIFELLAAVGAAAGFATVIAAGSGIASKLAGTQAVVAAGFAAVIAAGSGIAGKLASTQAVVAAGNFGNSAG